jgi:hypothetical protein
MSLNAFTFANVSASQTDSVLVTGATNRIILVKGVAAVTGATATNLTFNSKGSGSGTAISCLYANAANGGFVLPESDGGWFQTNSGESLTCTTGSGSATGIQISFCMITSPGSSS